ncbi:MAG TPA: L,D-transpeptidase [Acidimicrobiales bacterium]|nr:L,D-transpeptidase [Acidimicrobiales bacterium]
MPSGDRLPLTVAATAVGAALAALVALLAAGAAGVGWWAAPAGGTPRSPAGGPVVAPPDAVPPWTLIATVHGFATGYDRPGARQPSTVVSPEIAGVPAALPVVASKPGWVEVRLMARGSGPATAWLRASDVSLTRTPYRVVVDLARARVLLFRRSVLMHCAPAGIGTDQHPTPTGRFFVILLARPPNPAYGPFVILTSAVADTVTDWEQDGVPLVTVEGPLGTGAEVGRTGARVTTGSIRLSDADLERMKVLPAGAPIEVTSSLRLGPWDAARSAPRHARLPC